MRAVEHGASLADGRCGRRDAARSGRPVYHRTPWARLGLAAIAGMALCAGWTGEGVRGEPVLTVVRGVEPDGSEWLGQDLAVLWQASAAYDGAKLAVARMADPRARLRALRLGRAQFVMMDGADFSGLRGDFPEVVVLSALLPLPVHALIRGSAGGPLKSMPGTIVYNGAAQFVAQTLARSALPVSQQAPGGAVPARPEVPGAPSAAPAAPGPLLRALHPVAALDLLSRGTPEDLVLLAAPLGTAEIAALLRQDPAIRLVSLAAPLLDAVSRDSPWILPIRIARGTYPNQAAAVETVAEHLLLLTMPQLPAEDARRMLDCLYGRREQVAGYDPLFAALDRRVNGDYAKWAPFHSAAVKEFGLPQ
ncbi:MAG: TAXI family TRAP transporter solute-binding subunit [SAR324 cluster bacterium]